VADPGHVLNAVNSAIKEGKMPFLVANHQSLADGVALSTLTSQLGIGFNVPVAASIDEGQQGILIQAVNEYVNPVLARRNLFTFPIVTDGDVEKRGMAKRANGQGLSQLLNTALEGRGFAMFPEATVSGGRTNEHGGIYGLMVPPSPRTFTRWVEKFARHGKYPFVVPVGIDGSYKVFNPDTNTFPGKILPMLIGNKPIVKMGTVAVGGIIPFDDIGTGKETDDFFMEKISKLLPPSARGAYPLPSQ